MRLTRKHLIGAALVGLAIGTWLVVSKHTADHLGSTTAKTVLKPQTNSPVRGEANTGETAQDYLQPQAKTEPLNATAFLLSAKAGSFTPNQVSDAVAALMPASPANQAEIDRLLQASDSASRLLGIYLALESRGPTPNLLEVASRDPSPWSNSQAAEWLYLHRDYEALDRLIQKIAAEWSPVRASAVIASLPFARTGPKDFPPALDILQLGRGIDFLVERLLAEGGAPKDALRAALLSKSEFPEVRLPILERYASIRPEDYTATLRALITSYDEDSPARFKAFVLYGSQIAPGDYLGWLQTAATASPKNDPLRFRFDVALALASGTKDETTSLASQAAVTPNLPRLQDIPTLAALTPAEAAGVAVFLDSFHGRLPTAADRAILAKLADLIPADGLQDHAARMLSARIAHLHYLAEKSSSPKP